MTTLTATTQPETASVLLEIETALSSAMVITRTDANGANVVRLRADQVPIGGFLIVTDYEPALTGLILYTVTDALGGVETASVTFDGAPPARGPEIRRNHATNPSAEVDTAGWNHGASDTLTRVPHATAPAGDYVFQLGGIDESTSYAYAGSVPATPGEQWELSASFSGDGTARAHLRFQDSGGATIGGWVLSDQLTLTPAWQRVGITATAPDGTVEVRGYIEDLTESSSNDFFFDTILFGDPGPYFDGDTPPSPTEVYEWAGPAHASEPIAYVNAGPSPTTLPHLGNVQLPQLRAIPEVVTGYTSSRDSRTTIHRPIGRPDPLAVLGPSLMREGRLETFHRTYESARDLEAVLAAKPGSMVLLRQPTHPGMDMYFIPTRVTIDPRDLARDGWLWRVSCDYVETRSPNLPLLGQVGWSWADLAAAASSWATVRDTYDTWGDVLTGTPS